MTTLASPESIEMFCEHCSHYMGLDACSGLDGRGSQQLAVTGEMCIAAKKDGVDGTMYVGDKGNGRFSPFLTKAVTVGHK